MTRPLQSWSPSICALIALLAMLLPGQSEAQQAAGVVTAVKGDAQLTRGTGRKPLQFRDNVVLRDIVETQEKSLARILFGGSSTVTVRELSTLEVTEEVLPSGAKRTVYDMSAGAILVRVINKLMGPGDEVQIKTPNAIAAVRGTSVFTRCLARAAAALRCTFSLLAGKLTLTPFGKPPLTLTQNTSVSISGSQSTGTQISPITPLTTAEARQILADSDLRTALETDGVESGIAAQEMQQATQLASTIVDTVTPPIPRASELQNTAVPSDSEQTQAPVVAGGQGQAVDEAADTGITFPVTLPADLIDVNSEDGNTNGQPIAQINSETAKPNPPRPLLIVQNSNLSDGTTPDNIPEGGVNAIEIEGGGVENPTMVGTGGVVASNPSTFNFSGNYIRVTGGETTVEGPLSQDTASTFDIGESFLNIDETGSLDSSAPAVLQFNQSIVTTGNSLILIDGTASLSGSLLQAIDSDFQNTDGDFLEVTGSLSATDSNATLLDIDPTSVTTSGNFIGVNSGASLAAAGQLLTDVGGTYAIGEDFVHVSGELDSTATQPALELSGTTVSAGDDFIFVGPGGTVELDGSLLKATNSNFSNIGGDFLQVDGTLTTEGTTDSLLQIDPTQITTTGNFALVNGSLNLSGPLLTDEAGTYTVGQDFLGVTGSFNSTATEPSLQFNQSNVNVQERFLGIDGNGTFTSTTLNPLIELSNSQVTTGEDLVEVNSGDSLSIAGGLLADVGSNITVGVSLLEINDGAVTGTGSNPLVQFDGTTFDAQLFDVVTLFGGSLTLEGPLLTAMNNSVLTPEDSILFLQSAGSDPTVMGIGTAAFIQLADSTVANEANTLLPLIDLNDGTVTLAGPLALVQNSGVTSEVGFFEVTGSASLDSSSLQPLLTFTGDNTVVATALDLILVTDTGNLATDGDLVELGAGATLSLGGSVLRVDGGTVAAANILNHSGSIDTSEPLMVINGGSVTAAGSLAVLGADLTLQNSFLSQSNGTINVGTEELPADAIAVAGNTLESVAQSEGAAAPVFDISGGELNVSRHLVSLGGGTVDLAGPLLTTSGLPVIEISGDVLNIASDVDGPASGSVFEITAGSISASNLVLLAPESTLNLENSILNQSGGAINVTNVLNFQAPVSGPEAPLLDVSNGSLTATESLIVLGANVDLLGPVLAQTGGEIEVGNAIQLTEGGEITGAGDNLFDLTGGSFTVNNNFLDVIGGNLETPGALLNFGGSSAINLLGSLLNQSGGTVEVGSVVSLAAPFITPAGAPLIQVSGAGNLSTDSLVDADANLTLQNTLLLQTGGAVFAGTDALSIFESTVTTSTNPVFDPSGGSFTVANDLVNINNGTLTLGGELLAASGTTNINIGGNVLTIASDVTGPPGGSVFAVQGGTVVITGDLVDLAAESTLNVSDSTVLSVSGGTITTANVLDIAGLLVTSDNLPVIDVSGGSLSTTGALALVQANLDLNNSLLRQTEGSISIGGGEDAVDVGLVTLTSGAAPIFDFAGGTFTGEDDLLDINGGDVALGGPLATVTGGDVTLAGDVLDIDSTLAGPAVGSVFEISGGNLTAGADFLDFSAGSVLNLTGQFLTLSGGTVAVDNVLNLKESLTSPELTALLEVSGEIGGTTLNTTGSLAVLTAEFTGETSEEPVTILNLHNSLLSQSGGVINVGTAESAADALAIGANTVNSTTTAEPVFRISGGTLSGSRHLVSLAGGELRLGGPVLTMTSEQETPPFVTLGGDALNIASTVTGPPDGPLFLVEAGFLNGNDLVEVTPESTLELTGPILELRGDGIVAMDNVLNLGSYLTAPNSGALLISVADSGNLIASGSLVDMGADLTLGNGALLQLGGTVSVTGDAIKVGANTLTSGAVPVFRISGGEYNGAGLDTAMVSVEGGALGLGSPLALVSDGATVNLAGGFLKGTDATIDILGPEEVPETLLVVDGLATSLATIGTVSLIELDPSSLSARRALSITGGANVNLAAALLTDIGGTFFLEDLAVVSGPGSALTGAGFDALIQSTDSTFNIGTLDPEENPLGDFFRAEAGASVALSGALVDSQNTHFNIGQGGPPFPIMTTNLFLGVTGGAAFTTSSADPVLQFSGGSVNANALVAVLGSTMALTGTGALLGADSNFAVNLFLGVAFGSSFTSASPNPLLQIDTPGLLSPEAVAVVFNNSSLDLTGGLLNSSSDFDVANLLVVSGLSNLTSTATETVPDPLIVLSGLTLEAEDVMVFNDSTVTLERPLFDATGDLDIARLLVVDPTTFTANVNASEANPIVPLITLSGASVTHGDDLIYFLDSTVTLERPLLGAAADLDIGRLLAADLSTVTATVTANETGPIAELIEVTGPVTGDDLMVFTDSTTTLERPLLVALGDLDISSLLIIRSFESPSTFTANVSANESNPILPLLNLFGSTNNTNGDDLITVIDSAVTLERPLLNATGDLFVSRLLIVDPSVFTANLATNESDPIAPLLKLSGPTTGDDLIVFTDSIATLERPLLEATGDLDIFNLLVIDSLEGTSVFTANATGENPDALITLTGPLVVADDVVAITDSTFVTARPLLEATSDLAVTSVLFIDPASFTSTAQEPLIVFAGNTVATTAEFAIITDSSTAALGGTLLSATDVILTLGDPDTPETSANLLEVSDGSTLTMSGTDDALIDLNATTATIKNSMVLVNSPVQQLPPSLTLSGPLLRATNDTTLTVGDPDPRSLIALLDSATLTGPPPAMGAEQSLFIIEDSSLAVGGILTARRSLADPMPPTTANLSGPVLETINSTFDIASIAFSVREGAELLGTGESALVHAIGSAFSTEANFFHIDDTFGGNNPGVPAPARMALAGPLLDAERTSFDLTTETAAFRLLVVDNSTLTGTSEAPFILFTGTPEDRSTVISDDLAFFNNNATVDVAGTFVNASHTDFTTTFGFANFINIRDGAQVTGPAKPEAGDAPPFVKLDNVTVTTTVDPSLFGSRFLIMQTPGEGATPPHLELGGPLLDATGITYTTEADFVLIAESATLNHTGETALIQTENSTFNIASPVDEDPTANTFFRVDDSTDVVIGPAAVTLAGPLLNDMGSTFNIVDRFVQITDGSTLSSTTEESLITLLNSIVTTGQQFLIVDDFGDPDSGGILELAGPLLNATDTTFTAGEVEEEVNRDFILIGDGGELTSTSQNALITLDSSEVNASNDFFRVRNSAMVTLDGPLLDNAGSTYSTSRFFRVQEDATLTSMSPNALIHLDASTVDTANDFAQVINELTQVEVSGTLVHSENSTLDVGTNIEAPGDFLQISDGAQLTMNSSDPVVLIDGGSLTVGTDDGTSADSPNRLVLLQGRVEQEGSDQPIIGDGENGVGSLIEARNGAEITVQQGEGDSGGGNAVRLDDALLEASLPIVNLMGGEDAITRLTTARDAIFTDFGHITSVGPLVALDKSVINVTNGALLTLTNGSSVDVQGDLLKLINASRITIVNGPLIRADGGSVLDVAGALVNFGGTGGNLVEVNNSIAPTGTPAGIPVNTAGNGAVNINGPAIINPNLGSITVNGTGVPGEGGFNGSLIQSINNSTVNIGVE